MKYIEQNPNRCGGRPTIRGTRFTVAQLLAELAETDGGARNVEEICRDFELPLEVVKGALQEISVQWWSDNEKDALVPGVG